jgi:6-phosphogluconolactonase
MTINLTAFSDKAALTDAVSARIHKLLEQALQQRPNACLALSGGGTPMPIYSRLAGMRLDWSSVIALPTDERWVDCDHAASNYRQIVERFSGCRLAIKSLVPTRVGESADPEQAIATLAELPAIFDVVLLGMGGDGHFASLFPGSPTLAAGLDPAGQDPALAVTPDPLPPEAPFQRITLSLARLLATRHVMLVITGHDKREILERAARDDADPNQLPVAALLRTAGQHLPIYWSP